MNLNKVIIVGNLIKDPELKATTNGNKTVKFTVATNRTYKDREGNRQEDVQFTNVVFWGRQAEVIDQYMKKGSQILVEGRLRTYKWEKDGDTRWSTEVVGDNFQFGRKPENNLQDTGAEALKKKPAEQESPVEYPTNNNPDDIPFS